MEQKEEAKYNILLYTILKFEKSNNKLYKYTAVLSGKDGIISIPFGSCNREGIPYEQYHDKTGLRLYSDYDNYNAIKSRAWYKLNRDKINKMFYSSKMIEYMFLQKC